MVAIVTFVFVDGSGQMNEDSVSTSPFHTLYSCLLPKPKYTFLLDLRLLISIKQSGGALILSYYLTLNESL